MRMRYPLGSGQAARADGPKWFGKSVRWEYMRFQSIQDGVSLFVEIEKVYPHAGTRTGFREGHNQMSNTPMKEESRSTERAMEVQYSTDCPTARLLGLSRIARDYILASGSPGIKVLGRSMPYPTCGGANHGGITRCRWAKCN